MRAPYPRRFSQLLAVVFALALFFHTSVHADAQDFQPGHLILVLTEQVLPDEVDGRLGGPGILVVGHLFDSTTFLIKLPSELSIPVGITLFSQMPVVAYAGPNYICRLVESSQMSQAFLDSESDPFQAGITPDDFYSQYAVATTSMPAGLQGGDGTGMVIAQIDNGVDFTHPFLAPRLAPNGYDFLDDDADPTYGPGTYSGHGTFSAGLTGLSAPGAVIAPIRALDGEGLGTVFNMVRSIEFAISRNVEIIAMGFGLIPDDPVLRNWIARADNAGIVLVAPAGNSNRKSPPQFPAAYPQVIGVGAVNVYDLKTEFSNYGAWLDVSAPGLNMYSALPGGDLWGRWDGTSFAAPLTAGLAALVRAQKSTAPAIACRAVVRWGSDPIDHLNPGYEGALGSGRINFARSTGQLGPCAAIWGLATDSNGAGIAGVRVSLVDEGVALPTSMAITDASGAYAVAAYHGTYDLMFEPPAGSGWSGRELAGISLSDDMTMDVTLEGPAQTILSPVPGDLNGDAVTNATDLALMINHVYLGATLPEGESAASPDLNCSGFANSVDLALLINHVFFGQTLTELCD